MTLPYLAYAISVLGAGYEENALRRVPVAFVGLAQELGLRNAGTNKDMLNPTQVRMLARVAKSLTTGEREQAIAYAQAALAAIRGRATPDEGLESQQFLDDSALVHSSSVWRLPSLDFFELPEKMPQITKEGIRDIEQLLDETINCFVPAEVRSGYTQVGPRIIRFGLLPTGVPVKVNGASKRDPSGRVVYEKRTKISQITDREKDLQAALAVKTIRMLPPVPGKPYVGVEIPNPCPAWVPLREVLESPEYQRALGGSKLVFALGRDVAGEVRICDIAKAPHLLIAGATGAGKSMLLNTLIAAILTQATPDDVRMLMIDPKMVELVPYDGIPHLLRPVVTDVSQVVLLLKNAIAEMDRRYHLFSTLKIRNLDGYRKMRAEKLATGDTSLVNLPALVIIIDELADLMMTAPKEVEDLICRLTQKARATGIHLVIATQRPSVDVITGLIKANIPTRISFMVSSWVDSKTIIDTVGAEKLLGKGDMLYLPSDASSPERIQGGLMTDQDAIRLSAYWRESQPSAYIETTDDAWPAAEEGGHDDDEEGGEETFEPGKGRADAMPGTTVNNEEDDEALIARAITEVLPGRTRASISLFQRTFRIGYQRAARIMDELEARGMVSRPEGGKNERRVFLSPENNDQVGKVLGV